MILWPDARISANAFIDPSLDDALVEDALGRLRGFEFVDYIENPQLPANVQDWLGGAFVFKS